MKRLNCYIYTRVSTSMQVEGFSLDAQREKLRKYAEYQEMHIAGEYSDEGKSGKNIGGRLEFQRMLSAIASGKDNIDYVLVFKLSRSAEMLLMFYLLYRLCRITVQILSVLKTE